MLTFVTSGLYNPVSQNMRVWDQSKLSAEGGGRRFGSINRITVTATQFIVYENGPMNGTPVDGTILPIVPCRPSDPAESFLIRWKRGKPSKKTKKHNRRYLAESDSFQLNEPSVSLLSSTAYIFHCFYIFLFLIFHKAKNKRHSRPARPFVVH
jgi:hypothetical protein